jgi:hypothetical protein
MKVKKILNGGVKCGEKVFERASWNRDGKRIWLICKIRLSGTFLKLIW